MNYKNVVDAIYETVWDTGAILHGTCKVDLDTKEVFCIRQPKDVDYYEIIQGAFVILPIDGTKHEVKLGRADNGFWEEYV